MNNTATAATARIFFVDVYYNTSQYLNTIQYNVVQHRSLPSGLGYFNPRHYHQYSRHLFSRFSFRDFSNKSLDFRVLRLVGE
jgi:hypothetical protein